MPPSTPPASAGSGCAWVSPLGRQSTDSLKNEPGVTRETIRIASLVDPETGCVLAIAPGSVSGTSHEVQPRNDWAPITRHPRPVT